MYKQDLGLDNQQWLICPKTKLDKCTFNIISFILIMKS